MNRYLAKRWLLTRMAAQEFSFKQPFQIDEEYPIMMIVLILALIPLEGIGVFAYARLYGSIHRYALLIIAMWLGINYLIAKWMVARLKATSLADDTMAEYERMPYDERKRLYSFKSVAPVIFLAAIMPWVVSGIAIFIICIAFPR